MLDGGGPSAVPIWLAIGWVGMQRSTPALSFLAAASRAQRAGRRARSEYSATDRRALCATRCRSLRVPSPRFGATWLLAAASGTVRATRPD